jgi:hypothetical protein
MYFSILLGTKFQERRSLQPRRFSASLSFENHRGCRSVSHKKKNDENTLLFTAKSLGIVIFIRVNYNHVLNLVGGFNHLENMKVNGKDYPTYYGK